MSTLRNLVRLPEEVFDAFLAEDYDGIQHTVLVNLARGSSSAAMATIMVDQTAKLELGAPVKVKTVGGQVYVVSFGGRSDRLCDNFDRLSDEIISDHSLYPVVLAFTHGVTPGGSSHSMNIPLGNAGELILVIATMGFGGPTGFPGWGSGFISLGSANVGTVPDARGIFAYKIADGAEGSTLVVTGPPASNTSYHVYRIGSFSGIPSVVSSGTNFNANPDPPSLSIGSQPDNNLWIAACHWHNQNGHNTGYPAGYTNASTDQGIGNVSATSTARKFTSAVSENPGVFSLDFAPWTTASTIGIQGGLLGNTEDVVEVWDGGPMTWLAATGQNGAKYGIDTDGAYIGGVVNADAFLDTGSFLVDKPFSLYVHYKTNIPYPTGVSVPMRIWLEGYEGPDIEASDYSGIGVSVSFKTGGVDLDLYAYTLDGTSSINPVVTVSQAVNEWRWIAIDVVPGESVAVRTWKDTEVEPDDAVLGLNEDDDNAYIPQSYWGLKLSQQSAVFNIGNANNKVWFSTICMGGPEGSDDVLVGSGICVPIPFDAFDRTVATGLGATQGFTYGYSTGAGYVVPSVDGSQAVAVFTAINSLWYTYFDFSTGGLPEALKQDSFTFTTRFTQTTSVPVADSDYIRFLWYDTAYNELLRVGIFASAINAELRLSTHSQSGIKTIPAGVVANAPYLFKMEFKRGDHVSIKLWKEGDVEPDWQLTIPDTDNTRISGSYLWDWSQQMGTPSARTRLWDYITIDYDPNCVDEFEDFNRSLTGSWGKASPSGRDWKYFDMGTGASPSGIDGTAAFATGNASFAQYASGYIDGDGPWSGDFVMTARVWLSSLSAPSYYNGFEWWIYCNPGGQGRVVCRPIGVTGNTYVEYFVRDTNGNTVVSVTPAVTWLPNTWYMLKLDSQHGVKWWKDGDPEPSTYLAGTQIAIPPFPRNVDSFQTIVAADRNNTARLDYINFIGAGNCNDGSPCEQT